MKSMMTEQAEGESAAATIQLSRGRKNTVYKKKRSWPRELLVCSFLLIAGKYLALFVVGFQPTYISNHTSYATYISNHTSYAHHERHSCSRPNKQLYRVRLKRHVSNNIFTYTHFSMT